MDNGDGYFVSHPFIFNYLWADVQIYSEDINLPIAPVAGGMVVAALHLKTPPKTLRQSLEQLDLMYVSPQFSLSWLYIYIYIMTVEMLL